jgi:hypothetical protein
VSDSLDGFLVLPLDSCELPFAHWYVLRNFPAGYINDHNSPHSQHHLRNPQFIRNNSDTSFSFQQTTPQAHIQVIQRTASDVIQQPKPVPVGLMPGRGPMGGKVAWKLGSED